MIKEANFWQKMKKPIIALAPMEDVTDTVFRQIIIKSGRPDVFFSEFTSLDGIFSLGKEMVIKRFQFTEIEHPIVAQIWGMNPENYYKGAKLIKNLGFDGIDINMGCPQKKVVSHGACAALINNPNLAIKIIKATQKGASGFPISIKTRIGYKNIQTEEWITLLLKQNIDVLIVHGRTAKELSEVPNHWDEIEKARKIRDSLKVKTLVIGNGDIALPFAKFIQKPIIQCIYQVFREQVI